MEKTITHEVVVNRRTIQSGDPVRHKLHGSREYAFQYAVFFDGELNHIVAYGPTNRVAGGYRGSITISPHHITVPRKRKE